MISRSLGAEFGGSVGIVYYLAAAVGVTFYLTAFAESFCSFGIAGFDEMGEEQQGWTQFAVGSVTLIVLFVQANVGASFFLKFNTLIFAILVASIIIGGVSFIGAAGTKPEVPDFVGPNWDTFGRNRWLVPDYTTYFEVFIVIFPAVTGIMAGGELQRGPGRSWGLDWPGDALRHHVLPLHLHGPDVDHRGVRRKGHAGGQPDHFSGLLVL